MTRQPLPRRRAPLPPLPPLPPQRNASTPLQQAHQRPIPLKQPPPQARPAVPSAGSSVGFDHGGAELEHPRSILISRSGAAARATRVGARRRRGRPREACSCSFRSDGTCARACALRWLLPLLLLLRRRCRRRSTATPHHEFRAHNADAAAAVGLLQPRFPRHAVAPGISGHGRRIGLRIGARRGWGGNRSGGRRGRRCGVPG